MARVKVKLADNIARVVFIESDATKGATVGVDLMLNGRVATPATLSQWLNSGSGSGGQSTLLHSTLAGLQQGDDHPQYTMWQAAERITGQWVFERQVRVDPGTAALPSMGFINDVDTGVYSPAVGVVGVSANGTETFRFGSGGQLGIRGDFGTQDQALLSQGPGDSPEWTTLAPVALSNDYNDLDNTPTIPPDLSALDFTTFTDETTALPNSRRLVAGPNVTFDTTTPGELVIDAVSGGTGTVTSVGTGTGLTGGPITSSGTIALDSASIASLTLADTALQPGVYDAITLITQNDETSTFPASRRLVAGSNVTFDTTTPGQLTINASGGGGGGGQVDSIGAGTGISVNSANPVIPVVAVDTSANFTWTGVHTFNSSVVTLGTFVRSGTTTEVLRLRNTSAPANNIGWRHDISNAGVYTLSTAQDGGGMGQNAIEITRSGAAVGDISFYTGGTYRARISAAGSFQVGTSSGGNPALLLYRNDASEPALIARNDLGTVLQAQVSGGTLALLIPGDGRLISRTIHNNSAPVTGAVNGYIASGTYTPTIEGGAGLGTIDSIVAQWIRVGNVVTVSGGFRGNTGDVGITGTISLPIASAVSSGAGTSPLAGTLTANDATYPFTAGIRGHPSVNVARFLGGGESSPGGFLYYAFTFTYLVA